MNDNMLIVGINGTANFPNYQLRIVKDFITDVIGIIPVNVPDYTDQFDLPDLPFATYASEERAREIMNEIAQAYEKGESVYYMPEQ